MIVLDEPYVSQPLVDWLVQSQHPVLSNAFSRGLDSAAALNLVDENETIQRLDAAERVYTNSENALAWIVEHTANETLSHAIGLFKDKGAMRRTLAALNPDLFYKTCTREELATLRFSELNTPLVLKPTVGFCSMGVYIIRDENTWNSALCNIQKESSTWGNTYPDSVIGTEMFILESYLEGEEFALDAYFDERGNAHVLNVFKHQFASETDTSDRMYLTSAAIVNEWAAKFTEWLNRVNELVGARNIPVHVEVRVQKETVYPIEFNPLRFAGLGGTDLSLYAYGYRTYEAFLNNQQPNFKALCEQKANKVYSMSLLNPPCGVSGDERFDYEAFRARFSQVLDLRPFEVNKVGSYGFLFLETDEACADELSFLQNSDLKEFLQ